MATLKTNYTDDVLDTSQNTKRKYKMINNSDGTVSFDDETTYLNQGDEFGANDINSITEKIEEECLTKSLFTVEGNELILEWL